LGACGIVGAGGDDRAYSVSQTSQPDLGGEVGMKEEGKGRGKEKEGLWRGKFWFNNCPLTTNPGYAPVS